MKRKLGLLFTAALLLNSLLLAAYKAKENFGAKEYSEIPLIDFKDAMSRNGWFANPWGGGKIKAEVRDNVGDKFPWIMKISMEKTQATLSNHKLFEGLQKKWQETPLTGFYIWYRTSDFKGNAHFVYVCNEAKKNYAFTNAMGLKNDGKWHIVKLPLRGWNREKRNFNIKELKDINITFRGSGVFEIGEIGMLCSYRKLSGVIKTKQKNVSAKKGNEINIDGIISDAEQKNSRRLKLSLPDSKTAKTCSGKEPQENTDIFLSWNDKGIYCAARCFKKDMGKLKADFTENSVRIWEDECVEFYFDPARKMARKLMKKYAINANGKTGIENYKDRNKELKAAAKKFDDRWEAELFLPWETLQIKEKAPFAMGFNATRTTYDNNKMAERTGWTTPVWNAVTDFGTVFITKGKQAAVSDKMILGLAGKGKYVLAGKTGKKTGYKFKLHSPSGKELLVCKSGKLPAGKFELPFQFPVKTSGYYPFSLVIYDDAGNITDYTEGRISEQAMEDWKPLKINHIALFPEPKILQKRTGFFPIKPGIKYCLASEKLSLCGKKIKDQLKEFYNISIEKTNSPENADILIDLNLESQAAKNIVEKNKLQDDLKKIKNDGFLLLTDNGKIFITAKEKRGVLFGANALLDLIHMSSEMNASPQVCNIKAVDWPDFEIRYWFHHMKSFAPSSKYDISLYEKMLEKIPLHFRYNGFFLEPDDYLKWSHAPAFQNKANAFSIAEFKEIIAFIQKNYSPVMPSVQSHGHMRWLLQKKEYAHLREDGDLQTFCTGQPDSYKTLFGFYDEMLKLCSENPEYKPTHFIVQLDEVRWKTRGAAEDKKCKYCKGIPKNKIYIDHIKKISEYMKGKNVKPVMWSDMMIEEHNGLNEFKCVEIRDQLPKNMIMGHWSLNDYQSIPRFKKLGLENWKTATGYHVSRLNENLISGQMFLIWTYYWWLSYTRCKSQGAYGLMAQALYANAAWNIFPDDDNSSWIKYTKIYGNWLMHNWSRKPIPHANNEFKAIDISEAANDTVIDKKADDGKGWFDCGPEKDLSQMNLKIKDVSGIPVKFADKNGQAAFIKFSKLKKESAEIKIDMKAGSLILLHAADISDQDFPKFRERKTYGDPLKGKPIARYTVFYEDGKTETFEALFGWNLSPWNYNPMNLSETFAKYVIDSRSLFEGKTLLAKNKNLPNDIAIYQYEWKNPRPNIKINSIKIESLGTYASYGLLSLTARGAK